MEVVVTGRDSRDAVTLLSVFIALLFILQARWIIGPMGAIGSPALVWGLGLAVVWTAAKVIPGSGLDRGRQPMRVALLVFAGVMLASYANGQLRVLTELEQSSSTRDLIYLVSLLGVALVAVDGVPSRQRLDTLLRRLVLGAGFLAAVGALQFLFSFDLTQHLRPPGLSLNADLVGFGQRSMFNRPWGTSLHAIEFGVVLGAVLPLALHYAFTAPPGARRAFQWGLVLVIAAGVPMSVSRSGVVAIAVSMAVVALGWSLRRLVNMAVGGVVFTGAMWALIPGLIGTLRGLFTGTEHDPSVQARRERVPIIMDLVAERPWLGHGYGTFSVEDFLLVDNQLYVSAVETGLIGLAALIGLIVAGCVICLAVWRAADDFATRHLAMAIAAGLVSLLVCMYTFDALFYRQFTGVMYLLLGAAGALWRFTCWRPPDRAAVEQGARGSPAGQGSPDD